MYLILFDIDGTLVLTGRAGMRAMNRACSDIVRGEALRRNGVRRTHRLEHPRRHRPAHGRTLDDTLLRDLRQRYVEHLVEEIDRPGEGVKDVMPASANCWPRWTSGTTPRSPADGEFRRRGADQAGVLRPVEVLPMRSLRR
jgi:beta-phosphoglucomutase-like phosphatase (HAD superfamily)